MCGYDLAIGLEDDENSDGYEFAWINLPGIMPYGVKP
jgi:hypothetical protein